MPLGPPSSAVYIQTPSTNQNAPRTPTSITIHPVALFSILDHYLRRKDDQPRVIGTLLGTRATSYSESSASENEIHVHSSFAVLHSENSEQVAVDMEYHRTMFELHSKVHPKDVIVGWYSTGGEGNLNTYSALIQNFYGQETAPNMAIHVNLSTGLEEGTKAGVKGYVSSPVGVFPKPENCVFVPIPVHLRFERGGVDLLTSTAQLPSSISTQPTSELDLLEISLQNVSEMLDRVLTYVRSVLSGEVKGDPALGRYLMDTLGTSTEDLEKGGFSSRLQDTLMFSYLSNLVRSQAEVSSRLALVTS